MVIFKDYEAPFTRLRFCYDTFFLHQSYPFTLLRFCTKRREKHPFLCVYIDLRDNKYGDKDIRFSAFTLLRFCEADLLDIGAFSKTSVFVSSH